MIPKKPVKNLALKIFQCFGVFIFLSTAIGCMAPKLMPLSSEVKDRHKIYSDSELENIKYKRLGIVESFHCKRYTWDPPANYKNGLAGLTHKAKLLGGNALADLKCDTGGTELARNCWESINCIAAVIKIGDEGSEDLKIAEGNGNREQPKTAKESSIQKEQTPQSGTGSGFFVSKMGHVITNAHVVKDCNKLTVGDNANKQVLAEVVNTDGSNDLALLKLSSLDMASAESKSLIQKLSIAVVPLASKGLLRSEDVRLGEKVLVAGYPFGDFFSNSIKVTTGVVSSTRGAGDDSGQFQLDAAVQPGNSGGPIYDSGGNIVGVVISQLDKLKVAKAIGSLPENVNFGIKASTVRQFLISSGLPSKKAEQTDEKSTEQLAKIAQNQALMVMCLQ